MSDGKDGSKAPRPVIEHIEVEESSADLHAHHAEAGAEQADASGRAHADAGRFQDATWGFIEGIGHAAWSYADAHPHTVLYGAIGLILAVLILVVGLWHTIVIAIFVGVGAALGQMRDGEGGLYSLFTKLFGGKR